VSRVAPLILALAIAFVLVAGSSQPASSALLSSTATDISSGSYHSCALLSDSTVKCWGANFYGALGDGTTTDRVSPVAVSGIATATQVSSGHWHSCARLSDSTVKCWGYNGSGELGDGTTTNQLTPVSVSGITTRGTGVRA
jgi:alpha-tubulin suppressor-like RCC1 family protein